MLVKHLIKELQKMNPELHVEVDLTNDTGESINHDFSDFPLTTYVAQDFHEVVECENNYGSWVRLSFNNFSRVNYGDEE